MVNVELNDENWYDFRERCKWHVINSSRIDVCTKGNNISGYPVFNCAEFYCTRLKKVSITKEKNS